MEQKVAAGLTILLLVAITAAFLYYKAADIDIIPVISEPIDHGISGAALEDLRNSFANSDSIMTLRIPDTLSWKPGETGAFALGVKNKYSEERTLFLTVDLEHFGGMQEAPRTDEWLVFPRKKTIPPGEVGIFTIIARPVNPPPGTYYLYRILICETQGCRDTNSPAVYATTTFSFMVVESG